jgi:hypothetical protein
LSGSGRQPANLPHDPHASCGKKTLPTSGSIPAERVTEAIGKLERKHKEAISELHTQHEQNHIEVNKMANKLLDQMSREFNDALDRKEDDFVRQRGHAEDAIQRGNRLHTKLMKAVKVAQSAQERLKEAMKKLHEKEKAESDRLAKKARKRERKEAAAAETPGIATPKRRVQSVILFARAREEMAPLPDKRAYLALRGGFPPEIVDAIGEFQTADDQGLPDSILRSEMRDPYGRPAYNKN